MNPARAARLNGALLLCNLAVLLVNCFLAFKASGVSPGPVRLASDASGGRAGRPEDVAMPYSRVLQTLDSVAPGQGAVVFTPERLKSIYDAIVRYQTAIQRGVGNLVYAPEGTNLRAAYADLDKDAREEVEIALGARFSDPALVQRLATEVIRSCR
ncbi:MAG: hypothetical protein ACHQ1G_12695 [Planctomycetota bacterium]